MVAPNNPVTVTVEQIEELNRQLSKMRHDVNNHLSLVVAALELIRHKPEVRDRMLATLVEQPPKIIAEVNKFSADFERVFGIARS